MVELEGRARTRAMQQRRDRKAKDSKSKTEQRKVSLLQRSYSNSREMSSCDRETSTISLEVLPAESLTALAWGSH
jgi:hypothetical protein